jgi:hypothetical protein
MPKDQQQTQATRQRPVSCRFCRSRKLRCSREAPCSNCVSRGIRCELQYPPARSSPGALSASEPELLERIRKLEALIESQQSQQTESVKELSESLDDNTHSQRATSISSTLSPQIEHLDNDVAWLESIYNGQNLSVNILCLMPESRSDN